MLIKFCILFSSIIKSNLPFVAFDYTTLLSKSQYSEYKIIILLPIFALYLIQFHPFHFPDTVYSQLLTPSHSISPTSIMEIDAPIHIWVTSKKRPSHLIVSILGGKILILLFSSLFILILEYFISCITTS